MKCKFTKEEVYNAAVEIAILQDRPVTDFNDTDIVRLNEFEFSVMFCYSYFDSFIVHVNIFKVKDRFRSIWWEAYLAAFLAPAEKL